MEYKTNCVHVQECSYKEECDLNGDQAPYCCPDYEGPKEEPPTYTVVLDQDNDIVGVFDDTTLDEWMKETVRGMIDDEFMEFDVYAYLCDYGYRFSDDVSLNKAGMYSSN